MFAHPGWRGQSCRRPRPGTTGQCGDTGAGSGGGRAPDDNDNDDDDDNDNHRGQEAGEDQVQDKQVPGVPVSFLSWKNMSDEVN